MISAGSQWRVDFGDDTDLRDRFAMQAMTALLRDRDCTEETMTEITETAYRIANKMLSARARVPQEGPYLRVTEEKDDG